MIFLERRRIKVDAPFNFKTCAHVGQADTGRRAESKEQRRSITVFEERVREYMTAVSSTDRPKSENLMTGIDDITFFAWAHYWTDEATLPAFDEIFCGKYGSRRTRKNLHSHGMLSQWVPLLTWYGTVILQRSVTKL